MKSTEDMLTKETPLMDYNHTTLKNLVDRNQWNLLPEVERVKAIYNFVRDQIKFGYNTSDEISASEVLKDGYGQCNTKATLLMALLRAVGIPCRIHGSTIHKALQKGAISGIWYEFSPKEILHSWVEVKIQDHWYILEGVILDKDYLNALQYKFENVKGEFCGYGVYTDNFMDPKVNWNHNDTSIQSKGIHQDFGIFDSPDEFYEKHHQNLGKFKRLIYRNVVRHRMNRNVRAIRNGKNV